MNKNGKIILGIVIILIIIGLGFMLFKKSPTQETGTTTTQTSTQVASTFVYKNTTYGFNFTLPLSWEGYTLVSDTWNGYQAATTTSGTTTGQVLVASGPIISIRNPKWTAATPYQDIPVMIFTVAQWTDLQAGKYHIGAAPVGPSVLGLNGKYVFALPARYNYAYPAGYQEVDQIIQSKPLIGFDVK